LAEGIPSVLCKNEHGSYVREKEIQTLYSKRQEVRECLTKPKRGGQWLGLGTLSQKLGGVSRRRVWARQAE
jgi:hypothetical protein